MRTASNEWWIGMDVGELVRSYASLLLVMVFISAGAAKLSNRQQFRSTLGALSLLPAWSLRPASIGVPLTEILVAILLASGWRWLGIAGETAALLLLLLFLCFSAWIVSRGTNDVACSCFGPLTPSHFGPGIVIRNAVLATLAALMVVWNDAGISRGWYRAERGAIAVSGFLVLATAIIYVITTNFWANRNVFRTLAK